jgi:hypothetical protein
MGDYIESIVWLSLDNSTDDSQDNSYLPDFRVKLPHFFPLPTNIYLWRKVVCFVLFVFIDEIHQTGMLQVACVLGVFGKLSRRRGA